MDFWGCMIVLAFVFAVLCSSHTSEAEIERKRKAWGTEDASKKVSE